MTQILTGLEFLLLFKVFTLNFKIECAVSNALAEIAGFYTAVVRTFTLK